MISISIVSHNQATLVVDLLNDLQRLNVDMEAIITLNVPEAIPFQPETYKFPITVVNNRIAKGFGANHNQAFSKARGTHYCVLNPDIRIQENPFPQLLQCLQDGNVAVVSPKVVGPRGNIEDSARRFPTPMTILKKAMRKGEIRSDYSYSEDIVYPEWIGGMFMLFKSEVFGCLRGFNEKFFLYYEDVELCARLRLMGNRVAVCTKTAVVHDARRRSHRSWKYRRWHIASMLRFFLSPVFYKVVWLRR